MPDAMESHRFLFQWKRWLPGRKKTEQRKIATGRETRQRAERDRLTQWQEGARREEREQSMEQKGLHIGNTGPRGTVRLSGPGGLVSVAVRQVLGGGDVRDGWIGFVRYGAMRFGGNRVIEL